MSRREEGVHEYSRSRSVTCVHHGITTIGSFNDKPEISITAYSKTIRKECNVEKFGTLP